MMRALPHLEPYSNPKDALREITVNLGAIRGGTKPNLVADTCEIDLDCRHPPGTARADVEELLRSAFRASGEEVELDLFHEVPPASVPADADHVRRLRDLAGSEVVAVTYGTEMAYYAVHNPRCAVFGPGEPDRIHGPDERVSLAETVRAAEIYGAFAEAMAPSR
jgi:succinyl-diaminopimelate desuccinylase